MHYPLLLSLHLCCVLIVTIVASAAEPVHWADPVEQKAWNKIASRFSGKPNVKRNSKGAVQRIEVRNLIKDPKESGWVRVTFDAKTGHVIELTSDRAGFTNEEFQLFQPFTRLQKLTLWHNSNFHDKEEPIENYDARGLKYLAKLSQLERITLAGGGFADNGMMEVAKFPQLKYLGMWHVRVSDTGISYLRNHPGLEEIRLGPFWGKLMTDQTIAHLATCPNLKALKIGETWLTYENGFRHLEDREEPLELLDLSNTLIAPEDVVKIRSALDETEVRWDGLSGAGKVLKDSGWHRGKASKWMPEELIAEALATAP